jgi:acetylornithine/succinyldiaminopimelate/putrescine aminotransferase
VKPNTLRFIPPLIITEREVDEAIGILEDALGKIRNAKQYPNPKIPMNKT